MSANRSNVLRGARRGERAAEHGHAETSGVIDLAKLLADEPDGLEGALARAREGGRASRVFFEGAPLVAATADWIPWTSHPAPAPAPSAAPARGARRRAWPAALADLALVALLVACALAPRALFGWTPPAAPAPAPAALALLAPAPPALALPAPVLPAPPAAVALALPALAPAAPPSPVAAAAPDAPAASDEEPAAPRHARASNRAKAARARASGARVHRGAAAPAARAAEDDDPPPRPAAPKSALASALRDAAGSAPASEPAPAAAPPAPASASASGSLPERPSGSAVAAAITHVLRDARACLGDVPDPSRATLTFGPDGAVRRVDVSGPAAASSKMSPCIKGALGRAHVPPFAQDAYTASVTVRPL